MVINFYFFFYEILVAKTAKFANISNQILAIFTNKGQFISPQMARQCLQISLA